MTFVAPASLTDQEYTLTAASVSFTFDEFTVTPSPTCTIDYTFDMSDSAIGGPVVAFDASTRTFTFDYVADLNPLVNTFALFKDYTVTVTGTTGLVTPTSVSSSFNLRLKNPCHDPLFVSIDTILLPVDLEYILFDFSVTVPYAFSHTPFEVITVPFQHSYCGGLAYIATFEGAPIDTISSLMTFDTGTNTFEIYSEDYALLGPTDITVDAHLTGYPSIVTAGPETTQLLIIDPCIDFFTFTVPA